MYIYINYSLIRQYRRKACASNPCRKQIFFQTRSIIMNDGIGKLSVIDGKVGRKRGELSTRK